MIDKTSFENCKPYKIYRRTVCQKPAASKRVLLNGEETGIQNPEVRSQKSVVSGQ
jgi:hypothetical protein